MNLELININVVEDKIMRPKLKKNIETVEIIAHFEVDNLGFEPRVISE